MFNEIIDTLIVVILLLWMWKDREGDLISFEEITMADEYPIHEEKYSIKKIWVVYSCAIILIIKLIQLFT